MIISRSTTKNAALFLALALLLPSLALAARECPAIFKDLVLLQKQSNNPRFVNKEIAFDAKKEVKRFETQIANTWNKNAEKIADFISSNEVKAPYDKYLKFSGKMWKDKKRIGIWLIHFKNEILEDMVKAKDLAAIEKYKQDGVLPQKYTVKVLNRMAKEHGFSKIVELPNEALDEKDFFAFHKKGKLFFDPAFQSSNHGYNTHAIQVLFLADLVDAEFGKGTMKKWYTYMGKDEKGGWQTWNQFFDGFSGNFNQPERFGPSVQQSINTEQI